MLRNRLYRDGALAERDCEFARISDYLAEPGTVVWIDLAEPIPSEVKMLAEEVGLDPLAVEDTLSERQRTKVDRYRDHSFLSVYGLHYDPVHGLRSSELAVFVSPRYLITVRKDGGFDMDDVVARWDDNADLAASGVSYLLWGLLDVVVDGHFDLVQALDDEIEKVQSLLFEQRAGDRDVQLRTFRLRRVLVAMRRTVLPMREVLNAVERPDLRLVEEGMAPYYRDVYDHVIRVTEWTESLRDLIGSVLETNLAIQSNRLNEIMKRLTGWAAVIAVPTAVTGYYGMNVRFPLIDSRAGFWAAIGLIVVSTVGLYLWMRRRDWI